MYLADTYFNPEFTGEATKERFYTAMSLLGI
jgi:hypothetical protein